MKAKKIIQLCNKARKEGRDEYEILSGIDVPKVHFDALSKRIQDAQFYYFIGSILRRRDARRARKYFFDALFSFPLYPRVWLGLLRSFNGSSVVVSSTPATSRNHERK